jgi:hypothetical protein
MFTFLRKERTDSGFPTVGLQEVQTPEDFLNAVDWNLLNNLLDKLELRSGKSKKEIQKSRRIQKRLVTISSKPERESYGVTRGDGKSIRLYWHPIAQDVSNIGVLALGTLIHEAVHVRATRSRRHTTRGLSRIPFWNLKKVAGALNEGVTEMIAQEILHKYLSEIGLTSLLDETEKGVYAEERICLALLMNSIAHNTGVEQDAVWGAFVREYFNGSSRKPDKLIKNIAKDLTENPEGNDLISLLMSDRSGKNFSEIWEHIKTRQHIPIGFQTRQALEEAMPDAFWKAVDAD